MTVTQAICKLRCNSLVTYVSCHQPKSHGACFDREGRAAGVGLRIMCLCVFCYEEERKQVSGRADRAILCAPSLDWPGLKPVPCRSGADPLARHESPSAARDITTRT
jgi:hypothetical protein